MNGPYDDDEPYKPPIAPDSFMTFYYPRPRAGDRFDAKRSAGPVSLCR